ncbi:MAG: hypothetical protein EPO11_06870, partial [Gammaproteobacteria bacterium]
MSTTRASAQLTPEEYWEQLKAVNKILRKAIKPLKHKNERAEKIAEEMKKLSQLAFKDIYYEAGELLIEKIERVKNNLECKNTLMLDMLSFSMKELSILIDPLPKKEMGPTDFSQKVEMLFDLINKEDVSDSFDIMASFYENLIKERAGKLEELKNELKAKDALLDELESRRQDLELKIVIEKDEKLQVEKCKEKSSIDQKIVSLVHDMHSILYSIEREKNEIKKIVDKISQLDNLREKLTIVKSVYQLKLEKITIELTLIKCLEDEIKTLIKEIKAENNLA